MLQYYYPVSTTGGNTNKIQGERRAKRKTDLRQHLSDSLALLQELYLYSWDAASFEMLVGK